MRAFACDHCGNLLYFKNTRCLRCESEVGFDPAERKISLFDPEKFRRCAELEHTSCNWLLPAPGEEQDDANDETECVSCRITRRRPEREDAVTRERLQRAEQAKRHLIFELDEIGMPIESYEERDGGLAFDLLANEDEDEPVMTGHADGVITLDLAESDDSYRQRMRLQLGEPYRTVLGHLRHEVGHYYFPVITERVEGATERARSMFGDETIDYQEALDRHYEQGPPDDWPDNYVSAYATMHPSEDWAETFAHYLHIRGTLSTAASHRVSVLGAPVAANHRSWPRASYPGGFSAIIDDWLPLTYALNAINRSMGQRDLYPFVLSSPAVEKLSLVHELISELVGPDAE